MVNQQFYDDSYFEQQNPTLNFQNLREIYKSQEVKLLDNISPENIIQGQLGDCFFISKRNEQLLQFSGAMLVMTQQQNHIKSLFINQSIEGKSNIYGVWICINGEWKLIKINDRLPCFQNSFNLQFCKSAGTSVWCSFLEKAYAKAYGNYQNIIVGYSSDALQDLTGQNYQIQCIIEGAPTEYIDIKNQDNAQKKIKEGFKNGYFLTVSSKANQQLDQGLVSMHSYGIIDYKEIKLSQTKTEFFVKLSNPLQTLTWKNNYNLTPEIKKELGSYQSMKIHRHGESFSEWAILDGFCEFLREF